MILPVVLGGFFAHEIWEGYDPEQAKIALKYERSGIIDQYLYGELSLEKASAKVKEIDEFINSIEERQAQGEAAKKAWLPKWTRTPLICLWILGFFVIFNFWQPTPKKLLRFKFHVQAL